MHGCHSLNQVYVDVLLDTSLETPYPRSSSRLRNASYNHECNHHRAYSVLQFDAFVMNDNNRPITLKITKPEKDKDLREIAESKELLRLLETIKSMHWMK